MSKTPWVSKEDREEWRTKHLSGVTIADIATEAERDPSTISKHIRKAEGEQERLSARVGLYAEAIRTHNERMLAALRRLKERLSFVPPHRMTASSGQPGQPGIDPADQHFELDQANFRRHEIVVEGEHGLELELVREHLGDRVRLWRIYDNWREDHARYLWHAWRMGMHAARRFERSSGLGRVESGEGFGASCVNQICSVAIEFAHSGPGQIAKRLSIQGTSLKVDGIQVVHAEDSEMLERASEAIEKVVVELSEGDDAKAVATAVSELPDREKKLRRDFELIAIMGIVTGTCEACKPYSR